MKKIIGMVLFTGVVLLSPKIMSNIAEGIPAKEPSYNTQKEIKYDITERNFSAEIPQVQTTNYETTEPPRVNISPVADDRNFIVIPMKVDARYNPTASERKLLAALVWQEDRTSVESMMAVAEVVLNRLESEEHSFSKLKNVKEVIYQASWINGNYVEQYAGAKKLYKIDPPDEAFEAVDRVCAGETVIGNKALFHAEKSVPSWRIANNIYIVLTVGETNFFGIKEDVN